MKKANIVRVLESPKGQNCQLCHKNPVSFITRESKQSPVLFICRDCAPKYLSWGIVSYNQN